MDIQTLTLEGKEFVILPLDEYENLVDIASADKIASNIFAGKEELIPSEIVEALVSGENPIRVWRKYRGFTASALAEKVELSAAYISEIETGKKDGSISAIKRIASVLEIDIDDLV